MLIALSAANEAEKMKRVTNFVGIYEYNGTRPKANANSNFPSPSSSYFQLLLPYLSVGRVDTLEEEEERKEKRTKSQKGNYNVILHETRDTLLNNRSL